MKQLFILLSFVVLFLGCEKQKTGSLIDQRDGHDYLTVKIGDQWWMAENLAYMPFVSKLHLNGGIWVYGYNGDSHEYAKGLIEYRNLGCLYNWTTAMDISDEYDEKLWGGSDSLHQGVCPAGWHLPSDSEWKMLEQNLESDPDFEASDERQYTGDVGLKIKSDSGWAANGNGSNETGFGALPGGIRYRTGFYLNQGSYGYYWTATEQYPGSATYRYLRDSSKGTFRGFPHKANGLSIRCLKDN